uniref:Uncharacterized protein n=1 Tax=Siphoviridae sp. ctDsE1 TaxID=2825390 RepID=A0A8S5TYI7_9CAUD|nr:MAG TPA: hypothetical protein [Siphoviridae sp. ctDsE1]
MYFRKAFRAYSTMLILTSPSIRGGCLLVQAVIFPIPVFDDVHYQLIQTDAQAAADDVILRGMEVRCDIELVHAFSFASFWSRFPVMYPSVNCFSRPLSFINFSATCWAMINFSVILHSSHSISVVLVRRMPRKASMARVIMMTLQISCTSPDFQSPVMGVIRPAKPATHPTMVQQLPAVARDSFLRYSYLSIWVFLLWLSGVGYPWWDLRRIGRLVIFLTASSRLA